MKKFEWLLFDLDNTLVDFSSASKRAFKRLCKELGIPADDEHYRIYGKSNSALWNLFEQGKISTERLRSKRFEDFFDDIGYDHNDPMQANADYLTYLVDETNSYTGVKNMLADLSKSYQLGIVTNGLKEAQRARLKKVEIDHFFELIVVSDEIGSAKPDQAFFDYTFQQMKSPPAKNKVLIIGDSLGSDIQGGVNYNIKTCWLNHGRENHTQLKPDYNIDNVLDLKDLL